MVKYVTRGVLESLMLHIQLHIAQSTSILTKNPCSHYPEDGYITAY